MLAEHELRLTPQARELTHDDVARIACLAEMRRPGLGIIVDLSEVETITLAAFARLILLRRELLSWGQDLVLDGMRGRVAALYQVSRLSRALPARTEMPEAIPLPGVESMPCGQPGDERELALA